MKVTDPRRTVEPDDTEGAENQGIGPCTALVCPGGVTPTRPFGVGGSTAILHNTYGRVNVHLSFLIYPFIYEKILKGCVSLCQKNFGGFIKLQKFFLNASLYRLE
jgi:hypothetical protein